MKTHQIIAERQSVRRINDALGRFYSTLVYVYLSVMLGKDRHVHTVMLGKDRTHLCMHAWTLAGDWRDGEDWQERECYRIFQVG